jgi:hypothetical protein
MISLAGRWLFIHVPRTGGNALQTILVPHSDDRLVADAQRDGVERFEVVGPVTPRKHASLEEYRRLLPADVFPTLFSFAVVRNPWERAISTYFAPIRWGDDRPSWSVDTFRSTLDNAESVLSLLSLDGEVAVDRVLHHESLHDDVAAVLAKLGIPASELPVRNRGLAPAHWRTYYERHPELVAAVAERYADDIEVFGYRFEAAAA